MKQKSYKFSAFTLVEVIISLVLFSLLSVSTISIYNNVLNSRIDVQSKQVLIENSNKVVDLINLFADEYTIDYEEYFNRAQVGCSNGTSFWDVSNSSGYCSNFTAYWNENDHYWSDNSDHRLYVCSSNDSRTNKYPYIYTLNPWNGCTRNGKQSFGEYYWQFRDVHTWWINDKNDEFIATWPTAIINNTGVQELYLISKDNTQRLFFRRKCHDESNLMLSGGGFQNLCSIQILKLRGFDAWTKHNFEDSTDNFGVYDGVIDTWACDYAEWFDCRGDSVWWDYSDFKLPVDKDDGWEDLTDPDEISILDWNLEIYPKKSPWFSLAETGNLIPPFFILKLQSQLNVDKWQQILSSVEKSDLFLQNIFFMKKDMYENDVYNPCEQVIGREKLICPVDFSLACESCEYSPYSNIISLPNYEEDFPINLALNFEWGSGYWYDELYLVWPSWIATGLVDSWSYTEIIRLNSSNFWSNEYYLRLEKYVDIPKFCEDRLPQHYVENCTWDLINFMNIQLITWDCITWTIPTNWHNLNTQITQRCINYPPNSNVCTSWDPDSLDYEFWDSNSSDTTWACYVACNFWYKDIGWSCSSIFTCDDLEPTYKLNINNNSTSNPYYLEFFWNPLSDLINNLNSTYQFIPNFTTLVEWNYFYNLELNNVLKSWPDTLGVNQVTRPYSWDGSTLKIDESQYKMEFTISTGLLNETWDCSVDPCPD